MRDPFSPGFLRELEPPPRKVAIVRASRIGDFVVATPAIRSLAGALPGAELSLIGLPFLQELVDRSPYLHRFIEFPGYPGMAEQFFDARRAQHFFAQMQAEGFDLAVQLTGSGVYSNPFTLMLGAGHTVGWVRAGDSAGRLSAALPWPAEGHEVDKALSLPLFLGATDISRQMDFPLFPADRAAAAEIIGTAAGPMIGVHPGAREETKRWPPDRFANAAAGLAELRAGSVLLVGGLDEVSISAEVRALLNDLEVQGRLIDTTGATSLGVLGGLIERMSVLLTNDSGPSHIAYALGTPVVAVFGGTDPARWGPSGAGALHAAALANPIACWPCDRPVCPTKRECLAGISAAAVIAAAGQVMRA